jgi:pimeloyl-ACP methyl ester carboxylesterase
LLNFVRRGRGKPLLLVHGLGGSLDSWDPIAAALAEQRELILIDLPGHGNTPVLPGSGSFAGLADSVADFIREAGLSRIDCVGSSMGARIVLELARRGGVGNVVALDPGGFWQGWERRFFATTIGASVRLLRGLRAALPALSRNAASRTLLLAQLSARPWALDPALVAEELSRYARTPTFDALVRDLAGGPMQQGPAAADSGAIVIGWGRHDRLCLPRQAARAQAAFPSARLHWFAHSGHFPAWDEPEQTVRVILDNR